MNIALDVGHIGKPSQPNDRGAVYHGVYESDLVVEYVNIAAHLLTTHSHRVFYTNLQTKLLTGEYVSRNIWANANNIDVYIACHVNSGGGNYGLVMSSKDGNVLSNTLARHANIAMAAHLGYSLSRCYHWKLLKLDRGSICIRNAKMPAIVFEPFFIENPKSCEEVAATLYSTITLFTNFIKDHGLNRISDN